LADTINPNAVVDLYESVLNENGAEIAGVLFIHRIDIDKLKPSDAIVRGWLALLPDEFRMDKGGGWSFLNLCNDRNGVQWTGLHQTMDQLFVLAAALGRAKFLLPRSLWSSLPGGMPYVGVDVRETVDAG
jgi:hypothetical protein